VNPVGICYREGFLATRRYRQVHVRKWTRTRQSRELLQQKLFTPLKMTAANGDGRHDTTYVKPSTRLRQLIAQPACVQAPGVCDGISAHLTLAAGFSCMVGGFPFLVGIKANSCIQYVSGAFMTASRLGLPDLAFASIEDFRLTGEMIANIDSSVPVIVDADTGFGGPIAIGRLVKLYDRSGIAGFHIEDQGHHCSNRFSREPRTGRSSSTYKLHVAFHARRTDRGSALAHCRPRRRSRCGLSRGHPDSGTDSRDCQGHRTDARESGYSFRIRRPIKLIVAARQHDPKQSYPGVLRQRA